MSDFFLPNKIRHFSQKTLDDMYDTVEVYEWTWTLGHRNVVSLKNADTVLKHLIEEIYFNFKQLLKHFKLEYCIERHEDGFPHIHSKLTTFTNVNPLDLQKLSKIWYNKYGRNSLYLYNCERTHGDLNLSWDNYIRKDPVEFHIINQ